MVTREHQTAESFLYDADGNLIRDGRWTNTWDAENRLISMVSLTNTPSNSKKRLTFQYEPQWRRISKQVETWTGSAWTTTLSNKFLYDDWNLIAELNGTNNSLIRSYMWGTDLSDSLRGAGGVGGLLSVNDRAVGAHFTAFDGNGNIAALVKASDGSQSANYEYGPFGELLRATGPVAYLNPIRFSTKFQDDETGMLYYGYRYLKDGRWLSRDPLGEAGGVNLYRFIDNSPEFFVDVLGAWKWSKPLSWIYDPTTPVNHPPITVDPEKRKVSVGKCEIVIIFGHANLNKPYSWNVSPCAAGGAITCDAVRNSNGILPSQDLWPQIPDKPDNAVLWGGYPESPTDPGMYKISRGVPLADKVFDSMYANAALKALNLCKNGCCKQVRIRFIWLGHSDRIVTNPTNKQTDYAGKTVIQDYILDCSTLAKTLVPR